MEDSANLEWQRQNLRNTQMLNQEVVELQKQLRELEEKQAEYRLLIRLLGSKPFLFGYIVQNYAVLDERMFRPGEEVLVLDKLSSRYLAGGHILSRGDALPVVVDGRVRVKFADEAEGEFTIGLNDDAQQVALTSVSDGTSAVVNVDGKLWEIASRKDVKVGDRVRVNPETKQIISVCEDQLTQGPVCVAQCIHQDAVEIIDRNETRLVLNPKGLAIEEGDRVVVDANFLQIISKLPQDARQRYRLNKNAAEVHWDQIGGLVEAKRECQEMIEFPILHPELFAHYGIKKESGILLWGPPGNGKTMMAKAAATSLAKLHGKTALESGFIFVKSPEIMVKWVGETEREIRSLFERGRKHFRDHGYPAILVFDEFDAVAPHRGSRQWSSIADTVVPMFLGEMDGVDDVQNQANPIVFVMTNRPDVLDPAITRPGRISRHVKIDRPDSISAIAILKIHLEGVPFDKEMVREVTLNIAVQDIFSRSRLMYRVNNEHDFVFSDIISGAMLKSIADHAKMLAVHRDMKSCTKSGITVGDLRESVENVYRQQQGLDHSYDLFDFADKHGIQQKDLTFNRCFATL